MFHINYLVCGGTPKFHNETKNIFTLFIIRKKNLECCILVHSFDKAFVNQTKIEINMWPSALI